jgi:ssDNA-binding Zn-finger/Zn-ribbon topoisomerase 1
MEHTDKSNADKLDPELAATSGERQYSCPSCKLPMRRIDGRMGPFWGCSGFPQCKTTLNEVDGKPSTDINPDYRCPLCTRKLVRADKKKEDSADIWFCSGYSKGCKVRLKDVEGQPERGYRCKRCGQLLRQRQGKNGTFWGCSSYPSCTASYNDKEGEPEL